jgi:hypothetical protein
MHRLWKIILQNIIWVKNLELWYGQFTIPKGKTCMVEEPLHVKQLSLNQVCKIVLNLVKDFNKITYFNNGPG